MTSPRASVGSLPETHPEGTGPSLLKSPRRRGAQKKHRILDTFPHLQAPGQWEKRRCVRCSSPSAILALKWQTSQPAALFSRIQWAGSVVVAPAFGVGWRELT